MSIRTFAVTAAVLLAAVAGPVGAAMTASGANGEATAAGEAYAGSHVSFATRSNAVVNYTVEGATVAESVEVQSASEAEANLEVTGEITGAIDVAGSAVSLDARTETSASTSFESGATMTAHDHGHGTMVVAASDAAQYVQVNLSDGAEAESTDEDQRRVNVTLDDGTDATFVVVGEGNVSAESGNVTAHLSEGARLIVRSYPDGRDAADRKEERLIAEGRVAAEVYLGGNASDDDGRAAGVVHFTGDTTVEVVERSNDTIRMTAERSAHEGRVVIVSAAGAIANVSGEADSSANVTVTVDGEAAARASSYGDLRAATNGGATSKYLVQGTASAEADAEVLVAVNHFSTREVTVSDASGADGSNDGTGTDGDDGSNASDGDDGSDGSESAESGADGSDGDSADSTTPGSGPGFGAGAAVAALAAVAGAALFARRRR